MAQNSLYPGFVKITYAVNSRPHVQVLPVQPDGDNGAGVEPDFLLKNGSSAAMGALIDAYIALVKPIYHSSASFSYAEFWRIDSPEADPVFKYVHEIGEVGIAVTSPVLNSQGVLTMRSTLGGLLKLYFMDSSLAVNARDPYPFVSSVAALHTYLTDPTTGWICARDGSYPLVGINFTTKTNDALRKKYILNS